MPRAKVVKVDTLPIDGVTVEHDDGGDGDGAGAGQWGPAMANLDAAGRRFVVELFMPRANASKAFRAAGLGTGLAPNSLRVAAHRFAHSAPVIAATIEWARVNLEGSAPKMVANMLRLATSAQSEETRRKATGDVLNRAGLAAPIAVQVEHRARPSYGTQWEELRRLARLNGVDPDQACAGLLPPGALLGDGRITDAVYAEEPAPLASRNVEDMDYDAKLVELRRLALLAGDLK